MEAREWMRGRPSRACIVGIGRPRTGARQAPEGTNLTLQLRGGRCARSRTPGSGPRDIDGVMPFPNLGSAEEFAANLGIADLRFASTVAHGRRRARSRRSRPRRAAVDRGRRRLRAPARRAGTATRAGARARSSRWTSRRCPGGGDRARLLHPVRAHRAAAVVRADRAPAHARVRHDAEQLGAVAVACASTPSTIPARVMRDKPLTIDDYLASPMISEPYRLFDCCLETDGAAAVVVTTRRARARPARSSRCTSSASRQGQPYPADDIANRADLFETGLTHRRAARVRDGGRSRPPTSTSPRSTTASRSRCCSSSRRWASAGAARAGRSSRAAASSSAASCRSTRTAACSRRRTCSA